MNKRIRKIIGYILIILGIALPLFAFTKLTVNSFMSRSRYVSYKDEFQKIDPDSLKKREEEIIEYNKKIKNQSEKAVVDPLKQMIIGLTMNLKQLDKMKFLPI